MITPRPDCTQAISGLSTSSQLALYCRITENGAVRLDSLIDGGLCIYYLLDFGHDPLLYPDMPDAVLRSDVYQKQFMRATDNCGIGGTYDDDDSVHRDLFRHAHVEYWFEDCAAKFSAAEISAKRAAPIDWGDMNLYAYDYQVFTYNEQIDNNLTDELLQELYDATSEHKLNFVGYGTGKPYFVFASILFDIARVETGERTPSRLRKVITLYSDSPYFQQWMAKRKQNQQEELSSNFFMILVVAAVASAALYFMYSIMMAIHQPTPKPRHPCVAYTGDSGCGTSSDYDSTAYKINRMIESSR